MTLQGNKIAFNSQIITQVLVSSAIEISGKIQKHFQGLWIELMECQIPFEPSHYQHQSQQQKSRKKGLQRTPITQHSFSAQQLVSQATKHQVFDLFCDEKLGISAILTWNY